MSDTLIDELLKSSVVLALLPRLNPTFNQHGFSVSTNLAGKKERYVGNDNYRVYPEIIGWRPNADNPSTGTTVFAAFIETEKSLGDFNKIRDWQFLSSLSIVFYLVIPASQYENVRARLMEARINNVNIATYSFNQQNRLYDFQGI